MDQPPFEGRRIAGREALLDRAINVMAARGAVAVHLLGSLARGDGDALSDIDLWLTFPDDRMPEVIENRHAIYGKIAGVLISHEARRNSPLGGVYSLVLHRFESSIYQVDYYLAPQSTSVILPEARLLFGEDTLPRGEWALDRSARQQTSISERVDFLTCMAFIGVKKVLRGDRAFMSFLISEYRRFIESYGPPLDPIGEAVEIETARKLLDQLRRVASPAQRNAIQRITADHIARLPGVERERNP